MLVLQRGKMTLVLEATESGLLSGQLRTEEEERLPLGTVTVDGDRISIDLTVNGAGVSLVRTWADESLIGRFTLTGGESDNLSGMWCVGRMGS